MLQIQLPSFAHSPDRFFCFSFMMVVWRFMMGLTLFSATVGVAVAGVDVVEGAVSAPPPPLPAATSSRMTAILLAAWNPRGGVR